MIFRPWMPQLATVALAAGLALPVPATAWAQGPQTAVLQIRITLVAASSRCSVGTRVVTAGLGGGTAGEAANGDAASTLDIRCGEQSFGGERPEKPSVFASGLLSTFGAGQGNVALRFRAVDGGPDDPSWIGVRPLVSYRAEPARSDTLLISVEY